MLVTLSTVVTGNRQNQAGSTRDTTRDMAKDITQDMATGTIQDMAKGITQDMARGTTLDTAMGTTQAIPATPCSQVVGAKQVSVVTATADTRPCLHRLVVWGVEQGDVETWLGMK